MGLARGAEAAHPPLSTERPAGAAQIEEHPVELRSLGYIGVRSSRLDNWNAFATRLLGMQRVDRGGGVSAYRMDDRAQRLVVTGEDGDDLGFLGWEVDDADVLDAFGGAARPARCGGPARVARPR